MPIILFKTRGRPVNQQPERHHLAGLLLDQLAAVLKLKSMLFSFHAKTEADECSRLLYQFWEIEDSVNSLEQNEMSHVDQLVFATTKASLVYDGTRFSVDLLRKCGRPSLPDNQDVAM